MLIDNFLSDVKHVGMAKATARAGYNAANLIGHLEILRLMEMTAESTNPECVSGATSERFDCRFATQEDLTAMPEQFGSVLTSDYVSSALGKGDECYAIFDGSTCAAFGWYSRRSTLIQSELTLHFDPEWVYMYHGYTRSEYRGDRLHALGIVRAMNTYAERGIKGMISLTEEVNYRAQRSAYRMGFVDRGRIWRIGIGRLSRIGQTSSCDAYGVQVEA